ncbi:eukaryotic translation initiation factor 3 subunit M [Galendromus occidentalis]|uniref:Eukaryotic translation initiation factor 3 subunit M n=1 Tax=Galendromus occidentalis TaxID=34638 RepID=A0AAJ6QSB8_9ACAR|nr:eukaryotic translation initiation factor 3 subunit M [Galendromus occidentalis]
MSLSMFIPVMFNEQCDEIHQLFLEYGAPLGPTAKELDPEISDLIRVCDVCFKMPENDAESVLNGFVSILICKTDNVDDFIGFCKCLEAAPTPKMQEVAFNVLYNFFEGLPEDCMNRVNVYMSLIKLAGLTKSVSEVFQDVAPLKKWLKEVRCPVAEMREVYRALHKELLNCQMSDMGLKVMVELLSTYSEQDATEARADAERCIAATLADPNTFLMDHLLPLKPIKALQGQPIHELLKIFIYEKVATYKEFYQHNKQLVDGLGLDHERNVDKMRLLTFMMMAEKQREILFEDIARELDVVDVEAFTISALKTKLVSAKINQMGRKIVVISTMHRTFERNEWEKLRETLQGWFTRLDEVEQCTSQLIDAQGSVSKA